MATLPDYPDYPYLGDIGLWQVSAKARRCFACHLEIPAAERFFAFGGPGSQSGLAESVTPYHRCCALYVFSDGTKPPALYAYPVPREELAIVLPEPEFAVPGSWRSARQQYICRHCAGLIRLTERYFDYTGESALYSRGTPYHRRCAIEVWSGFTDSLAWAAAHPPEPGAVVPEED